MFVIRHSSFVRRSPPPQRDQRAQQRATEAQPGALGQPEFLHGRFVKDADPHIVEDLDRRGLLLKVETYTHAYPFSQLPAR